MAESTLSLAMAELQARVGTFMGWGRGTPYGDTAWTSQQQFEMDGIVGSGLRQFYYPPPSDGQPGTYDWSFLKPVASLTLAQGATTIALPDDFGGCEGRVVLAAPAGQSYFPVEIGGIGDLYSQTSAYPSTTGRPKVCCQEPLKGTTQTTGQRFQLHFWPIADQAYTIRVQYYVLADYLTSSAPYALGGSAHAETVLESCLAVAEERLDDTGRAQGGVHATKFRERLAASIGMDRKNKPQKLGYNDDASDWHRLGMFDRPRGWSPITVNGVQY